MVKGDRGLDGFDPSFAGFGLLVLHLSFGSEEACWLWRSGKVLHLKLDCNLGVVGLLTVVVENNPNS